jgi:hypothetical protein
MQPVWEAGTTGRLQQPEAFGRDVRAFGCGSLCDFVGSRTSDKPLIRNEPLIDNLFYCKFMKIDENGRFNEIMTDEYRFHRI